MVWMRKKERTQSLGHELIGVIPDLFYSFNKSEHLAQEAKCLKTGVKHRHPVL